MAGPGAPELKGRDEEVRGIEAALPSSAVVASHSCFSESAVAELQRQEGSDESKGARKRTDRHPLRRVRLDEALDEVDPCEASTDQLLSRSQLSATARERTDFTDLALAQDVEVADALPHPLRQGGALALVECGLVGDDGVKDDSDGPGVDLGAVSASGSVAEDDFSARGEEERGQRTPKRRWQEADDSRCEVRGRATHCPKHCLQGRNEISCPFSRRKTNNVGRLTPSLTILASPKSVTLHTGLAPLVRRRFSGLRSRWVMPRK